MGESQWGKVRFSGFALLISQDMLSSGHGLQPEFLKAVDLRERKRED